MTTAPRVDWRIAAGCAAALATLFAVQQWIAPPAGRPGLELSTAFTLQAVVWGVWLLLLPLIIWSARARPLAGRPTAGWVAGFVIEGCLFAIVHGALSGAGRWLAGVSLSPDLTTAMMSSVSVTFASNVLRYWAILMAYQAYAYHVAARDRDRRAAQLEVDLVRARLATLEAYLRPHFLFNTLNAIASLVRDDPRAAETMIGQLSELLRASLDRDPSREVRLEDELALVTQYLAIEQARFGNRLHVDIDVTPEVRKMTVSASAAQPACQAPGSASARYAPGWCCCTEMRTGSMSAHAPRRAPW
jgi:hypothetical protein